MVRDILIDLMHQFAHAMERAAPDRLVSDEREAALDLVEPVWRRPACNECDSAGGASAML